MVQKKVPGITLYDFLKKNRNNHRIKLTYDCADIYEHVVAQQTRIGYNHGDIRGQNIMVNPVSGAFNTLIDWDCATVRIPENEAGYEFTYRVGVLIIQCRHFGFLFSNPPQTPTTLKQNRHSI